MKLPSDCEPLCMGSSSHWNQSGSRAAWSDLHQLSVGLEMGSPGRGATASLIREMAICVRGGELVHVGRRKLVNGGRELVDVGRELEGSR